MALFYIQDYDRPMYVVADSYNQALIKYEQFIKLENNMSDDEEVGDVLGITHVCSDSDLIL